MLHRLVVLVAVLVCLSGCAVMRALAGPDPDLVAAAPTIEGSLDYQKAREAANTELLAAIEKARLALEKATQPRMGPFTPEGLTGLGWLFGTVPGLTIVGTALTTLGGLWKATKTSKKVEVVTTAVDHHATLIDLVTPESAEFAARIKTPAPPSG